MEEGGIFVEIISELGRICVIIIIYAFRLQRHCAVHNKSPNISILCHIFILFTCIVLKLPSLLFFTNVLNSTFSKSFPIYLIHANFCPPVGFLQGFFASFNDFLAGVSSGNLKR